MTFLLAATIASLLHLPTSDDLAVQNKILGTWFGEWLHPEWLHIAGRYQYRADGVFIADYRRSQPGESAHYIRTLGRWGYIEGIFWETVDESTDESYFLPRLWRPIVFIDSNLMVLGTDKVSSIRRGPDPTTQDTVAENQAELDSQWLRMGILGWTTFPAGAEDKVGWRIISRIPYDTKK